MSNEEPQVRLDEAHSDRKTRRQFLKMTGAMTAMLPWLGLSRFVEGSTVQSPIASPPPAASRHTLWYRTAAPESNVLREGLPIGNGRLGALIGGDPARSFLYLTDATMWLGKCEVVLGDDGQFEYTTQHFGSLVMLASCTCR